MSKADEIFVTTSRFSAGAKAYAAVAGVELIDGDMLASLVRLYFKD